MKIFIGISLAFMLGAAVASGYVWYLLQNGFPQTQESQQEPATSSSTSGDTQHGSISETIPEEGITLPPSTLSEGQRGVAKSIGIDVDSFVITASMVMCAEEKLGTQRVQEIMEGATPSVLEAARIAGCL